jgi:hypothetical protein
MSNAKPQTVKYKTVLHSDNDKQTLVYYETPIVEFDEKDIILNTGGYRTHSTQSRMNWVSREFDLGFRIQAKGEEWVVNYQDEEHPFTDEAIRLKRKTGKVTTVKAAE